MARLNTVPHLPPIYTAEGARAVHISKLQQLRRLVLTALLWEDTAYSTGKDVAKQIADLVPQCKPEDVAALAIEARDRMYLRHVPLYLVRQLAKVKGNGRLVAQTLSHVIQRPDEMGEYLAMYQQEGKGQPISAGSKRGLAAAFGKFNEYTLAKYDRDGMVKLRDILRICHPKPASPEQAALWKKVIARELATPDTWETELSAGKDKRETFERLLRERKLGGLAFLRNLRNMVQAGVDTSLIRERFRGPFDKVLPFRFIAALRHAPSLASDLNDAMLRVTSELPKMQGKTIVLVDVSGSMDAQLSARSEMQRIDVATGLAVLVRELIEDCRVFSFSSNLVEVASYRGIPLVDAIQKSQVHSSTYLGRAIEELNKRVPYSRMIVITDEQSHDRIQPPVPGATGYIINVSTERNGVGYGPWTHVDGWSEKILDFIAAVEAESRQEGR